MIPMLPYSGYGDLLRGFRGICDLIVFDSLKLGEASDAVVLATDADPPLLTVPPEARHSAAPMA